MDALIPREELIEPKYKNRKPIGFRVKERHAKYIIRHKRDN